MASRRTHTKSRTGCLNCKRRKVKCDEARPSCFHCTRHGVVCSLSSSSSIDGTSETYSPSLPNLTPSTPSSLDSHHVDSPHLFQDHSHPSPTDQIAPFPPHELWARDCELMHHYCTVTAESLSIRKDLTYVWSVAIPRLGYQDPFVMHGILAIAAAQKAYMLPASRKTYLPLVDYHQTLGSEGYRRYLQHFDLSNWMPVFGFASVVVLHMLTLPMRMENRVLESPITNIIEVAGLIRGIRTTLEPVLGRVVRSEFAPVVFGIWMLDSDKESERYPNLDNSALPRDTWAALRRLRAFQEADIPATGLQHYAEALDDLETSVRLFAAAGVQTESGAVQFWLYSVHDGVLLDLAAHRPHALLLFAHYLVHWAVLERKFWYVRGWSQQLMAKIEEGLIGQPMFLEMLNWPKQKVAEALAYT
ncbi:hypothetical protein FVEN_g11151 [Fusarium venenatum]|uniref:Zn(2)-C6 fungal-type domain-containing protein n=1 Tax=Fusarium venenatum TaxID=56646 RepID=A0A2L2TCY9_9HYPO|nr:uncharacterized protein FVRRES_08919 [Fusarium venenatum]KAG8350683.1 hypothetical protein FVEN_g11151 [Fusarium venenatum]KAH6965647.1 hypothetical protein EDB82DRAFT_307252 [Fusarium venenatum]CEI68842.1 unnamed protein product [Fusarium venenatum]